MADVALVRDAAVGLASLVERGPDWAAAAERDTRPPAIIPGVLAARGIAVLASRPKAGKTWLAIDLMLSVANGRPFLGAFPVEMPGPCLLVSTEGDRKKHKARLQGSALGKGLAWPDALQCVDFLWRRPVDLANTRHATELAELAASRALIVVDTFRGAHTARENSADDIAAVERNLRMITDEGATVLLIHHTAKPGPDSAGRTAGEKLRGGGGLYGALDSALYLTRGPQDERTKVELESRDDVPAAPFTFTWPTEAVDGSQPIDLDYREEAQLSRAEELLDEVVMAVRRSPGLTKTAVSRLVKGRRADVLAAIDIAMGDGAIFTLEGKLRPRDGGGQTRFPEPRELPEASVPSGGNL